MISSPPLNKIVVSQYSLSSQVILSLMHHNVWESLYRGQVQGPRWCKYLSLRTCVFGGKDEFVARGAPRNVGFGCVVPGAVDLPGLVVIKQVGQQILNKKNMFKFGN